MADFFQNGSITTLQMFPAQNYAVVEEELKKISETEYGSAFACIGVGI
ncbi:MAG: hypothetical protein ACRCUT_11555 [Spirochaetota bacterium]